MKGPTDRQRNWGMGGKELLDGEGGDSTRSCVEKGENVPSWPPPYLGPVPPYFLPSSDLLRPLENHRETVTMLSAAAATRASGHSSITYARWMAWPALPHLFMLHAQGLLREEGPRTNDTALLG